MGLVWDVQADRSYLGDDPRYSGAAVVLFVKVDVMTGAVVLTVAFLISPYGIPKLAAWLTGKLGGLNYALRDFVMS